MGLVMGLVMGNDNSQAITNYHLPLKQSGDHQNGFGIKSLCSPPSSLNYAASYLLR